MLISLFLTTSSELAECSTLSGPEFRGWAPHVDKPRHHRLVRPRTFPDGNRDLGSTRPSPPPFPDRRHPSSAGWARCAEADRRHQDEKDYDTRRHDLLHDTYEAHRDGVASESSPGWPPHVEGVPDTHTCCWNGVAEEGLSPGCPRNLGVEQLPQPARKMGHPTRGRPYSNRAISEKTTRKGRRILNLSSGSSIHRQLPKRPRWDARFWVRARDVPAVRVHGSDALLKFSGGTISE